jgi:hypothetical protein
MTAKGISNKGDALVHFVRNRAQITETTGSFTPEIIYPRDLATEELCPFGFLKKISNKYGRDLWHCLKQQGPDSKGEPVLLADGEDQTSIRAICEACLIKWQRGPSKLDQVRLAFEQLSQSEITSKLYFCERDILNGELTLSTSENSRIYCRESNKKVTIKRSCIAKNCPYLITKIISLDLIETLPIREAQKALEVLK